MKIITKDGKNKTIRIEAFPSINKDGNDFEVILLLEDISKFKSLEENLNHRMFYEQMISQISTRFLAKKEDEIDLGEEDWAL
jgi:hypothetical protein